MMDIESYGVLGFILFILFLIFVRFFAVMMVAGAISTFIGLNGLLWWCSSIVIFLIINAIISGFSK